MLIYCMSYFTVYSSMMVFRGRGYARPQAELDFGCKALVGLLEVWERALRGPKPGGGNQFILRVILYLENFSLIRVSVTSCSN